MMTKFFLKATLIALLAAGVTCCRPVVKAAAKAFAKPSNRIIVHAWKSGADDGWRAGAEDGWRAGADDAWRAGADDAWRAGAEDGWWAGADDPWRAGAGNADDGIYSALGTRASDYAQLAARLERRLEEAGYKGYKIVVSDVEISDPGYVLIEGPLIAGSTSSYYYLHKKDERKDRRP